jgi:hypothetical protein
VSAGQSINLCAVNLNTAPVTVAFVLKDPSNTFFGFNSPATIPPGGLSCSPSLSVAFEHSPVPILVSIVLQSPNECSQAIDYPGKCRVLGSLEISGDVEGTLTNRIHLEPVLLTGSPGRPQIPIAPR